jgi:hypothetical protein
MQMDRATREELNREYLDQLRELMPRVQAREVRAGEIYQEIEADWFGLNRRLADKIAGRFSRVYRLPCADCRSEAYLGLINAMRSVADYEIVSVCGYLSGSVERSLCDYQRRQRKTWRKTQVPRFVQTEVLDKVYQATTPEIDTSDTLDRAAAILSRDTLALDVFRTMRTEGCSIAASARICGYCPRRAHHHMARSFRVLRLRLVSA